VAKGARGRCNIEIVIAAAQINLEFCLCPANSSRQTTQPDFWWVAFFKILSRPGVKEQEPFYLTNKTGLNKIISDGIKN
jgi:hypothetical protein